MVRNMHGGGHAWQGGMHGRGMHGGGHAWQWGMCGGGGIHGRGHAWQGACMVGGVHGRRDGHFSGRYASYWNAFLFFFAVIL